MSSASYRRSSRPSYSSGYGLASSGNSYGGSSSYGYGRSSGIGSSSSSSLGSSSIGGSNRYSSGLDSLGSSRDYKSPRSYLSSRGSSASSSYSSRPSSYLSSSSSSSSSSRSNVDNLSTRSGYIPSSSSLTSSERIESSARRRTSVKDATETDSGRFSRRKSSIDEKTEKADDAKSADCNESDKTLNNRTERLSYSKDANIRNEETSFSARRSDLRRRRNEVNDSDTPRDESKHKTTQNDDSSSSSVTNDHNRRYRRNLNDSGEERIKDEEKRIENRSVLSNRYSSWSSRRRYSRDGDAPSEESQGVGNFDGKLAGYIKDCEDQITPKTRLPDANAVKEEEGKATGDKIAENVIESRIESRAAAPASRVPSSSSWRSSTFPSSSRFGRREEGGITTSEDTQVSGADLKSDYNNDDERPQLCPDGSAKTSKLANGTARTSITAPTSSTTTAANSKRSISSTASQSKASKEVVRLESLCEARTKELTHTKMQLKATVQGFDAMAVLLNYCCTELDAFQCPQLAQKLEKVQKQLTDCMSEIGDLTAQKETLNASLTQVTKDKEQEAQRAEEALTFAQSQKEDHERLQREMDTTHNAALTAQRDQLTAKHDDQTKRMKHKQDDEMKHMKEDCDRKISAMANDSKLELSSLRLSHLEQIEALRAKHDSQMEELHKQHRNKLEDITHRFESIKVTLSDKVESLRGECDDLRVRARASEEALQKDADVKVQMALAPFINLPKEIESLKTVLEMRNEEVQKLRSRNMDLEKHLEEIPIAREKIISLQQKVENLEAIINIKTDHEKQLHEKCQVLMRKYDRESRANKRLSMDYEQVMWRMSQSEYGSTESLTKRQLSRSPPRSETTSPDPRRRRVSPGSSDVTLRMKKRSSNSESDSCERKLRSRSATFVLEKDESKDRQEYSPESTQSTPRRSKKKENGGDGYLQAGRNENMDHRMCYSAGAELITAALEGSKQAWSINTTDSALNDEGMDSLPMGSTGGEMAASYARSISGVSDSGVYDSMTRSDMLNSSIISTDSEWMASTNVSMTLDSTNEEDLDPFVKNGYRVTSSDTVLDMTSVQGDKGHADTSPSSSSVTSGDVTVHDKDLPQDTASYNFQLTLPAGTAGVEDDVFTEKADISHQDIKTDCFIEKANCDHNRSSPSEGDASLSHNDSAISSNDQSQPP